MKTLAIVLLLVLALISLASAQCTGGCCSYPNAVCCPSGNKCCPWGTVCHEEEQKCSYSVFVDCRSKQSMARVFVNVISLFNAIICLLLLLLGYVLYFRSSFSTPILAPSATQTTPAPKISHERLAVITTLSKYHMGTFGDLCKSVQNLNHSNYDLFAYLLEPAWIHMPYLESYQTDCPHLKFSVFDLASQPPHIANRTEKRSKYMVIKNHLAFSNLVLWIDPLYEFPDFQAKNLHAMIEHVSNPANLGVVQYWPMNPTANNPDAEGFIEMTMHYRKDKAVAVPVLSSDVILWTNKRSARKIINELELCAMDYDCMAQECDEETGKCEKTEARILSQVLSRVAKDDVGKYSVKGSQWIRS